MTLTTGEIVRDAAKLKAGDALRLRFARGYTNATVDAHSSKE